MKTKRTFLGLLVVLALNLSVVAFAIVSFQKLPLIDSPASLRIMSCS